MFNTKFGFDLPCGLRDNNNGNIHVYSSGTGSDNLLGPQLYLHVQNKVYMLNKLTKTAKLKLNLTTQANASCSVTCNVNLCFTQRTVKCLVPQTLLVVGVS